MPTIYYDNDADLSIIQSKKVAIIGYGSQGHAHALNLKDSGVDVAVGLAEGSKSRAKAQAVGLAVKTVADAAAWADVIMILVPDTTAPKVYRESIAPHLTAGKTLMFAHGFNIRYGTVTPPKDVDVSMIAPKSPGHRVRELFVEGGGTPALVASWLATAGSVPAVVAPSERSTIVAASFVPAFDVPAVELLDRMASSAVSIASPAAVPRPGCSRSRSSSTA